MLKLVTPRHACAARDTVVVLSVCRSFVHSVCLNVSNKVRSNILHKNKWFEKTLLVVSYNVHCYSSFSTMYIVAQCKYILRMWERETCVAGDVEFRN